TGVALNPIACLLSRVRVGEWRAIDDALARLHGDGLVEAAARVSDRVVTERAAKIPRVEHWFDPWAQRLLAGATSYIEGLSESDPWRDRLALSMSSALVK